MEATAKPAEPMEETSLNESFSRMQKLAGVIK